MNSIYSHSISIQNIVKRYYFKYLLVAGVCCFLSNTLFGQCCTDGVNLLVNYNPNFSAPWGSGNPPGFVTDNTFCGTSSYGAGCYAIIVSRNYGACSSTPQYDHTVGNSSGSYLWFDTPASASPSTPAIAWMPFDPTKPLASQNLITVIPGTDYVFSVWIRDLARNPDCITGGAPVVTLKINADTLITLDLGTITSPCCPAWGQLCIPWNSGTDTTALLKILSVRGAPYTDLGIDDVYFGAALSPPTFKLGNDTSICGPISLTLQGSPNGGNKWSTGDTSITITVTSPGTYWCKATSGCVSDSDTIHIYQNFVPVVNLGPDTTFCSNFSLQLKGAAAGNIWSTGDTSKTITASLPGIYWCSATTPCGFATDTIHIYQSVKPIINLGPDTLFCGNFSLQLKGAAIGNHWSTGDTSTSITVTLLGTYWCTATTPCGTASDTINISEGEKPQFILGNDTMYCSSFSRQLSAYFPSSTYLWSTGDTSSSITVSIPGTYSAVATNDCGSTQEFITISSCTGKYFVANAFTPGNATNNLLGLFKSGDVTLQRFNIYNRWGQLIFSTTDDAAKWDGNYNGSPESIGTYVYSLTYTTSNNAVIIAKGNITLLR